MNKKLIVVSALLLCAVHFGFEWGTPPKKAKTKAPAAPAAQSAPAAAAAALPANATLGQMMTALSQNLSVWPALSIDDKKQSIEAAKLFYRDTQNTAILRSAEFYAQQIDEGLRANPAMMNADIMTVLRMMAVVEYDFYNGQNKDALAREVLGEKAFESFKARR